MPDKKHIIDSHVHLDMVARYQPGSIQWMKENNYGVVSWAYSEKADSVLKLREYLKVKAGFIRKHSDGGLPCWYLAGIHPRCIPPDLKPEHVGTILSSYMEDPLCKGIGEIGLEIADSREKEIFIAQLEFGRCLPSMGKTIGVHTPRSNKLHITETILKILERFRGIAPSIVVDHCTEETITAVLNSGFSAGVTLSPLKSSIADLKSMLLLSSGKPDRIMCNTDSAIQLYEDLYNCRKINDLPEEMTEKIFYNNAASFFTL